MNSKQKIEKKVFSFMKEHHMLKSTDRVVVGVSGGADSVCLLLALLEYRKQIPFSIAVVHVNHGIRQEADRDRAYLTFLQNGTLVTVAAPGNILLGNWLESFSLMPLDAL